MDYGGTSWTTQLTTLTDADFVYNYGISGSTIQKMNSKYGFLDRCNYMNKYSDYIIIWGGTNDFIWTGTDISTFEKAYEDLIKSVLDRYPMAKIIGITPMKFDYKIKLEGMYTTNWNQANSANGCVLKDYRDAEIRVLEKYGIEILDLFDNEYMSPENEEWINLYFDSDFDKLHPNTRGNAEIIAPQIANKIN